MRNHILEKTFVPAAAIAGNRIVKHDASDNTVVTSALATDEHLGVSTFVGADPANQDNTVDVVLMGIAEVKLGGTVTRGDKLTSDAYGRAITATTEGQRVVGIAMKSGIVDDIQPVFLAPSVFAVSGSA
jgi:hypothetical protein